MTVLVKRQMLTYSILTYFLGSKIYLFIGKEETYLWVPEDRRRGLAGLSGDPPPQACAPSGLGSLSDTFILLGQEICD